MIPEYCKGIIEIGSENIKCLIFKVNKNNITEILSTSTIKSEGIHNGVIVNLAKSSSIFRSCISDAEKKAQTVLKKINVVLEQPEFLCTKFSKHRKINGSKIDKDDIEFLLKEAKKEVIINDKKQSIIHIFNHNYVVDGKTFIEEPIGVFADSLSHEITFITMPKNNIRNINQAFIDCEIEVERYISCIFALGVKFLTNEQLQLGSLIIDVGFEKTSLGIFKNLAIAHSATIPIGTNHITKDISKVCSLSLEESEIIKNKIDLSFQNNNNLFDKYGYLKDSYFNNSSFRKISKSLIINVVKARLGEIFDMIKKQINISGFNSTYASNFFLIGDYSQLTNLENYCSNFFNLDVKKLYKNEKQEENTNDNEKFNSCMGALNIIKDGWETEALPEVEDKDSQKISFFSKIFGNSA